MLKGAKRCKFFDEKGRPGPTGACRLSSGMCRFVHPDQPEWANALPPPAHLSFSGGGGRGTSLTGSNNDPLGPGRSSGWGKPRSDARSGGGSGGSRSFDSVWGAGPGPGAGLISTSSSQLPSTPTGAQSGGWGNSAVGSWGDPQGGAWGSSAGDASVEWGDPQSSWGDSVASSWGDPQRGGWGSPVGQASVAWGDPQVSWGDPQGGEWGPATGTSQTADSWGSGGPGSSEGLQQESLNATAGVRTFPMTLNQPQGTNPGVVQPPPQNQTLARNQGKGDAPDMTGSTSAVSTNARDPSVRKVSVSEPTRSVSRALATLPRAREVSTIKAEMAWDPSPIVRRLSTKDSRVSVRSRQSEQGAHSISAKVSLERSRFGEDAAWESDRDAMKGMFLYPTDSVDEMDVDTGVQDIPSEPLLQVAAYVNGMAEAVYLRQSLENRMETQQSLRRLRHSDRHRDLKPGDTAFEKMTGLSQSHKAEVQELKTQLDAVVQRLVSISLFSIPSTSSTVAAAEEKTEEIKAYFDEVKEWLADVKAQLKKRTVEEEILDRIIKLEDKLASLDENAEELRQGDRKATAEYLSEKLSNVQHTLVGIYDSSPAEENRTQIQSMQDEMRRITEQFNDVRSQVNSLPERKDIRAYKEVLQELQKKNEESCAAYKANEEELKNLRGMVEALRSAPTRAPAPVVTKDDLIAVLLPLLREEVRADLKVACDALHEGVTGALHTSQNQISSAVWVRLHPVLQFAQSVQEHMAGVDDERPEQASSSA